MNDSDQEIAEIRMMLTGLVCEGKRKFEAVPEGAMEALSVGLVPMLVAVMRDHLSKAALKRVGAVATRIALALENVEP